MYDTGDRARRDSCGRLYFLGRRDEQVKFKGVRLELNTVGLPYQFVDGLPIPYQDTTTRDSSGGFANVLPGLVVVRGFDAETMQQVGLETMPVRSQWVTVGSLMPQFAGTP